MFVVLLLLLASAPEADSNEKTTAEPIKIRLSIPIPNVELKFIWRPRETARA